MCRFEGYGLGIKIGQFWSKNSIKFTRKVAMGSLGTELDQF